MTRTRKPAPTADSPPRNCLTPKKVPRLSGGIAFAIMLKKGTFATPPANE
jgi:hypothetical protein